MRSDATLVAPLWTGRHRANRGSLNLQQWKRFVTAQHNATDALRTLQGLPREMGARAWEWIIRLADPAVKKRKRTLAWQVFQEADMEPGPQQVPCRVAGRCVFL